jgi:hypothetical protein
MKPCRGIDVKPQMEREFPVLNNGHGSLIERAYVAWA